MTLAITVQAQDCCKGENPYKKYTQDLPFGMLEVKAPVIPERQVNLKDFGAVGDGATLCTDAFAKAIEALSNQGGGHLIVPNGVWFTGPIILKSNIDLHLEMGAVIKFSADESLYAVIKTSFEGLDTRRCQSPLSANGAENGSHRWQWAVLASCQEGQDDRRSVERGTGPSWWHGVKTGLLGA